MAAALQSQPTTCMVVAALGMQQPGVCRRSQGKCRPSEDACFSVCPAGFDGLLSCCVLSGAATGQLLNTLHTPAMSYHGHKQMNRFTQWSVISFLFSGYQVNTHPDTDQCSVAIT
jgi:hypothetical protein